MKDSIEVKHELTFDELPNFFWSGARDRWVNATENQREKVWDLILDVFGGDDQIPSETDINDFVWFECDDVFDEDDDEEIDEAKIRRSCRSDEEVKTDYSGGFTDCMKAVDKMLETYYENGQVEILVTDNGIATVTVFPEKGSDETVTVQLDYPHDKAILMDDQNHAKSVAVDVDKTDFDKLGKAIIDLVDGQLKTTEGKKQPKPMKKMKPKMRKSNIDHI